MSQVNYLELNSKNTILRMFIIGINYIFLNHNFKMGLERKGLEYITVVTLM